MLFAAGYVHAQDRLWQMEMHRRIATGTSYISCISGGIYLLDIKGRMAEALGEGGLIVDRIFRTFGLARKAQKDLEGKLFIALLGNDCNWQNTF